MNILKLEVSYLILTVSPHAMFGLKAKLENTEELNPNRLDTIFDRRKIEYESDLYSPSYVEDICQQAWLYGTKSFGIILWETVINFLDNAYRIKQTPEILNMYSETYQMFSSKLRIASIYSLRRYYH